MHKKSHRPRSSRRSRSHPRRSHKYTRSRSHSRDGRGSATRGWKQEKPSRHERTIMRHKCGAKCFLGPGTSFPICVRNTCRISPRGVHAAYGRAREWKHGKVASKARRIMKSHRLM